MTRRDEHTSPLGDIILARAELLGARRRGDPEDVRPLSLKEMSDEVLRLTGQKLTRGAINEWILGRVKRPTPELLGALAAALADFDCDRYTLEAAMRDVVGLPPATAGGALTVDCSELAPDDVAALNAFADRLREKGREAAEAALGAMQRVGRPQPRDPDASVGQPRPAGAGGGTYDRAARPSDVAFERDYPASLQEASAS